MELSGDMFYEILRWTDSRTFYTFSICSKFARQIIKQYFAADQYYLNSLDFDDDIGTSRYTFRKHIYIQIPNLNFIKITGIGNNILIYQGIPGGTKLICQLSKKTKNLFLDWDDGDLIFVKNPKIKSNIDIQVLAYRKNITLE